MMEWVEDLAHSLVWNYMGNENDCYFFFYYNKIQLYFIKEMEVFKFQLIFSEIITYFSKRSLLVRDPFYNVFV